ncbi:MAG: DUF350 domain-containing protein [Calditrichia bacterium]
MVYGITNPRINLRDELVKKDNLAMALAVIGYYFGLIIALGGVLSSESAGLFIDLFEIFFYGIISIVLMNFSIKINDKIILSKFDNIKEIIDDQNAGTGVVEAANHIAVGMIIAGAMSGDTAVGQLRSILDFGTSRADCRGHCLRQNSAVRFARGNRKR